MIDNYTARGGQSMELKIANCRGKKPVVKDIEKARKLLQSIIIEINPCKAKDDLKDAEYILTNILKNNI